MIKRYRKKPVIVEAIKYTGDNNGEVYKFIKDIKEVKQIVFTNPMDFSYIEIPTLKGILIANQGSYIVKGVKGEFYPVKADIFEETYEEVLEDKESDEAPSNAH